MQNINFLLNDHQETALQLPANLEFGRIFTDHVFEMDYDEVNGWHNPTIRGNEPMLFSPATMVLHYGQAVFEGLKAYKTESGEIAIFRPDRHFRRLNNSARRLCIPEVDEEFMIEALKELIKVDKEWVPEKKGTSLYIRPFVYGSDPLLGVKPSKTYKLLIILSPVGAYYPEGFKPVKILAQDDYVRAVRKGLGDCKTPANYAASLLATQEAQKRGFTQVLWMDGVEQKYIEEVGTMNIFVRFKDEIATPKLTGSILPGITRATVLELLRDKGINVNERLISMQEVIEEYDKGNVLGIFGTGTAAVISSVGTLSYKDKTMTFKHDDPNDFELNLFNEILAIQYGLKPDNYGWLDYIK
ncbi:MAG: branched-chain amino acid aminotransferase [Ignavibacteria bacterium]|jgi:branched-chain amino acid aminotransferase|nr:branched-chain amino acid aminotransferase [Ignavibacteria bacterium]MCU7504143.1 branched-chain amino acid aminotransferase [Ignavibacteria bacterium]MCU7516407.1 branched-chain amino acid aminotransferase [Ignavibacteria bacterium]